jgi:WD40 repeat-containing protein SMU1
VRELIEARETEVARSLLRTTIPLLLLKREDASRYARLEHLATKGFWDVGEAYGVEGSSKEAKRHEVARLLSEHLVSVPPSRLMALLSQAVKWQYAHGALPAGKRYDLFRGCVPLRKDIEERACILPAAASGGVPDIRFGASAYPVACEYSPDGSTLVAGCVDGIIECYEADSGRLRSDLAYQAADDFMMHDDAVLALTISRPDGELLATGSRDGRVKVWRIATGECLRRFNNPHGGAFGEGAGGGAAGGAAGGRAGGGAAGESAAAAAAAAGASGVTALCFSRDASQLLTGGFDGVVKVHGLRSGKTLKEYRGHSGTITSVVVAGDGSAVSSSADGTVRVWDGRGTECLAVIKPPHAVATADVPILSVHLLPRTADHLLVLPRSGSAFIMTLRGVLLKTIALPATARAVIARQSHGASGPAPAAGGTAAAGAASAASLLSAPTFVAATVSPQGRFIYAIAEDRGLYVFSARSGQLEASGLPASGASGWQAGGDAAGAATGGAAAAAATSAGSAAAAGVGDALGLAHHPLRNLLASFGPDGVLRVWQPPFLADVGEGLEGAAGASAFGV